MSANCYYCGCHPDEIADSRRRRNELEVELERLRNVLKDIYHQANEGAIRRMAWDGALKTAQDKP